MFFLKKQKVQEIDPAASPIYIAGDGALTCYLALKFMDAGERVIIISHKKENYYLSTNGINFREDLNLQKKHYRFETSFLIKEQPKLFIFIDDNSLLPTLSPSKLKGIPTVVFSDSRKTPILDTLLNKNYIRAFFEGFADKNDQSVVLYGRKPIITFSSKKMDDQTKEAIGIFKAALFSTHFEENLHQAYWDYFAPMSLGSILSGEDKKNKVLMLKLAEEISSLAGKYTADIDADKIVKQVLITPEEYVYPLQQSIERKKTKYVDSVCSTLTDSARSKKVKIPELQKIIKQIYNSVN